MPTLAFQQSHESQRLVWILEKDIVTQTQFADIGLGFSNLLAARALCTRRAAGRDGWKIHYY